jgi:hypothetical protein
MGFLVGFIEANQTVLQFTGSLVLALFGYYTYCNKSRKRV